jgi:integrase
MKLTEKTIAKLTLPEGKSDHIEFCDDMRGFGLRLRGKHRSFILQYKIGKVTRRYTIGDASRLTVEAARTKAKEIYSRSVLGEDPQGDKKAARSELTLGEIAERYLQSAQQRLRESSFQVAQHHLNKLWQPLHRLPLSAVIKKVIAARLSAIAKERGPVSANRAADSLSAMFAWAIGEGLYDDNNPVIGTNKQPENAPRERTLSDNEVAKLWLALPADSDYGRIVKLLLLTGCRREEIASLQWSEVDLGASTITLPKERCKNNQTHVVPLSDAALTILKEIPRRDHDFVFGRRGSGFSGYSKAKRELDAGLELAPWVIHDLRRTVRTGLGKIGVAPHIAEAVLNHLPAKLIRTYDKNKYEAEKRDALERWSNHLAFAIAQASGANVVKLVTA